MAFTYDQRTHKITCPRNNNGSLQVNVSGMELTEADVVAFYVRDPARGRKLVERVQHPTDGSCVFTLDSDETAMLPPGKYRWNLRIVTMPQFDGGGDLTTAADGANSITVWNNPPEFEVLEV